MEKKRASIRSKYGEYGSEGWFKRADGKKYSIESPKDLLSVWYGRDTEEEYEKMVDYRTTAEERQWYSDIGTGMRHRDEKIMEEESEAEAQERNRIMFKQPEKPLFSEGDEDMRYNVMKQQYPEDYDDDDYGVYNDDGWSRTSSSRTDISYAERERLEEEMGISLDDTESYEQIMERKRRREEEEKRLNPEVEGRRYWKDFTDEEKREVEELQRRAGFGDYPTRPIDDMRTALERISYDSDDMVKTLQNYLDLNPSKAEDVKRDILGRTKDMLGRDDDDEGEDIFLSKYIRDTYGKTKRKGGRGVGPTSEGSLLRPTPLEPRRVRLQRTPDLRQSRVIKNQQDESITINLDNKPDQDHHLFSDEYINDLGLPKMKRGEKIFGYDPKGVTRNAHLTAKKGSKTKKEGQKYKIGVDGSHQELRALYEYLKQGNPFKEKWRFHFNNYNSHWRWLKKAIPRGNTQQGDPGKVSKSRQEQIDMYEYLRNILN